MSSASAAERVFILAGQSNMVGQGKVAELPEKYKMLPKNVELYSSDNGLVNLNSSYVEHKLFGPEVSFAHEISTKFPEDKVILYKFSVGGSSLLSWSPNWTVEGAAMTDDVHRGALYGKMKAFFMTLPEFEKAKIESILWMQGESDSKYPAAAALYAENLKILINALRSDYKTPDAAFLIGRVNPPMPEFVAQDVVRQGQFDAQSKLKNVLMFNLNDLTKWQDDLHYDTAGIIELGKRFAHTYINSVDNKK